VRAAILSIILLTAPASAGDALVGRASVVDGDTIEIAGERVRFDGIDAPESAQFCRKPSGVRYRCGKVAADALDEFLSASRPTTCEYKSRDRYGRFVGVCFRADGQEVNAWLVRQGYALDWPRYSKGRYAAPQGEAERRRLGMWRGSFDPPWEWRRSR
jgi:endonuclease YncB( thermonuclease family)